MITPQKVCSIVQPHLTCPQQSCLDPLPFFADTALRCLILSPTISEALHPRDHSPVPLAQCWYIQHWFWLWQRKDDCFEFLWRNRVIVIYQSFVTLDDCGSWGGSFVAELVSLCENPAFGRMPPLPLRHQTHPGGKIVYLSVTLCTHRPRHHETSSLGGKTGFSGSPSCSTNFTGSFDKDNKAHTTDVWYQFGKSQMAAFFLSQ